MYIGARFVVLHEIAIDPAVRTPQRVMQLLNRCLEYLSRQSGDLDLGIKGCVSQDVDIEHIHTIRKTIFKRVFCNPSDRIDRRDQEASP